MGQKVLKVFPSFILGKCRCGCGEDIPIRSTGKSLQKFISGHNGKGKNNYYYGSDLSGEKCPAWKGGRCKNGYGYILIWKPDHPFATKDGYVKEHRLIYEDHYKCCILPWGVLHHINRIKDDNRIENLELISNSKHSKIHHPKKDMSDRICSKCNNNTYVNKSGYYLWYGNEITGYICHKCYQNNKPLTRIALNQSNL